MRSQKTKQKKQQLWSKGNNKTAEIRKGLIQCSGPWYKIREDTKSIGGTQIIA